MAVILTLGKAYGTFYNKYLYLANITIFAAGSALCGAAPNMEVLIAGRVIVSLGATGMYLVRPESPFSLHYSSQSPDIHKIYWISLGR